MTLFHLRDTALELIRIRKELDLYSYDLTYGKDPQLVNRLRREEDKVYLSGQTHLVPVGESGELILPDIPFDWMRYLDRIGSDSKPSDSNILKWWESTLKGIIETEAAKARTGGICGLVVSFMCDVTIGKRFRK